MEYTAKSIADLLLGKVIGNSKIKVTEISRIQEAKKGSLSFLANPAYVDYLQTTNASIILINKEFIPEKKIKPTLIVVEDSYKAFAVLAEIYQNLKKVDYTGIEKFAYVDKKAILGSEVYVGSHSYISSGVVLGDNVKIYPQVYIGEDVKIGKNSVIYPGVKIYYNTEIGENCTIHSGAIIGGDGFGFVPQQDGTFLKIQQIGNVIIEENVEIGANTTVDRATLGSTIIKSGVKLDNLIQIAHNVEIGSNTVIAAHSGVSGSTKIGENCLIGGQVGFVGHINIANRTNIGAQAGIVKSVKKEGSILLGSPAFELSKFHRSYAAFKNLPAIRTEISELKKEIEELKKIIKGAGNQ